jgi:hypothetical protein
MDVPHETVDRWESAGFFRRAGKPGSTAGKDARRYTATLLPSSHFYFGVG